MNTPPSVPVQKFSFECLDLSLVNDQPDLQTRHVHIHFRVLRPTLTPFASLGNTHLRTWDHTHLRAWDLDTICELWEYTRCKTRSGRARCEACTSTHVSYTPTMFITRDLSSCSPGPKSPLTTNTDGRIHHTRLRISPQAFSKLTVTLSLLSLCQREPRQLACVLQ